MKSRVSILVFVLFNSARVCVAQEMAQSVFNCDNSMLPLAVLLEIKASCQKVKRKTSSMNRMNRVTDLIIDN